MSRFIFQPRRSRQSKWILAILIWVGWSTFISAATHAPPGLPGSGDIIGRFSIAGPGTAADASYLALEQGRRFFPARMKTELLVIEVFNVYCASCQFMRPYMNELYAEIEVDPQLKNRVKMLAIGAGNDQWDIKSARKGYDFPLFPDEDYLFHKLVGRPPTPFLIFARPYDQDRLVVVDSHLGRLKDADALMAMVRGAFETETSQLNIKAPKAEGDLQEEQTAPAIPLSDVELMAKVRQSLTINGQEAEDIAKITLPGWGSVYAGRIPTSPQRIFARVVARAIPCIDCHDVFYIYSFNADGVFFRFIPISISKYGNRPWDAADVAKIENRFRGRSIIKAAPFNAKVDAISSATISSALIYDAIEKTGQVLEVLTRQGHIPRNSR